MTAMMTDSLVTCSQYLFDYFDERKAELGLKGLFYGDQVKIPHTPTLCIEPGTKRREQQGEPRLFYNNLEVVLLLYLQRVQSPQANRMEADVIAEAVELELHKDARLGGLAIRSYVGLFESGYAERGNTLFRSARMTVQIESKTRLLP